MTMTWIRWRRRKTATAGRWTDVSNPVVGIERRIEQLRLVSGETMGFVDLLKDGDRWVRIAPCRDAGGHWTAEVEHVRVGSLARAVADFVAMYVTVAKVVVRGVSPEELRQWIEPFLDQDQEDIRVNGQTFDVYPWVDRL